MKKITLVLLSLLNFSTFAQVGERFDFACSDESGLLGSFASFGVPGAASLDNAFNGNRSDRNNVMILSKRRHANQSDAERRFQSVVTAIKNNKSANSLIDADALSLIQNGNYYYIIDLKCQTPKSVTAGLSGNQIQRSLERLNMDLRVEYRSTVPLDAITDSNQIKEGPVAGFNIIQGKHSSDK